MACSTSAGQARLRRDDGFAVVPVAVGLCVAMLALALALATAVVRAVS